eukprot:gene7070-7400_t
MLPPPLRLLALLLPAMATEGGRRLSSGDPRCPAPPRRPAGRARPRAGACSNGFDCSLAGDCVDGRCRCDPAFTGPTCAALNLLPARRDAGYNPGPNGSASWGGNPVLGPDG